MIRNFKSTSKINEFHGDNYLQYAAGETYILSHKEKGKNIYIGTPPLGNNIYLNIVVGKYEDIKEVEGDNYKKLMVFPNESFHPYLG
ncbi:MAG: hypothetical protein ACJ0O9_04985 [Flavobacteriaceae bacterium]